MAAKLSDLCIAQSHLIFVLNYGDIFLPSASFGESAGKSVLISRLCSSSGTVGSFLNLILAECRQCTV